MKRIEINLAGPFGEVLASLRALEPTERKAEETRSPGGDSSARRSGNGEAEVKKALRSIYDAAHGRQVETQIGLIAIAPPVAGFLKDKLYHVATQNEFFVEAFARILIAASPQRRFRKHRTSGTERNLQRRRHGQL